MIIKMLIGFLVVLIAGLAYIVFAPGKESLLSRLSTIDKPQTDLPILVLPYFYTKIGTCTMNRITDPLVISLEKEGDTVKAMLYGKINKMGTAADGMAAGGMIIEVISPNEDQREGFLLPAQVSVFDSINKKSVTLEDLKVGQFVHVGFSCTPNDLSARTVTSIAITNNKAF